MHKYLRLLVCAPILAVMTACVAAGVVATPDPATKLRDAIDLFDKANQPLPAEKLIVEAIAQCQAENDMLGLADGYRVYGMFFGSRSVAASSAQRYYSDKGFLGHSATWEGRYRKSIQYLQKSEALLTQTDRKDLLSNVYYHMGDDYVLMHDTGSACPYCDRSMEANTEFHLDHPATEVALPKKYNSFDVAIAAAKRTVGCPE